MDVLNVFHAEEQKTGRPLNFFGSLESAPYQLRALIYQARDLMAADDNGQSDPYGVRIFIFGTLDLCLNWVCLLCPYKRFPDPGNRTWE